MIFPDIHADISWFSRVKYCGHKNLRELFTGDFVRKSSNCRSDVLASRLSYLSSDERDSPSGKFAELLSGKSSESRTRRNGSNLDGNSKIRREFLHDIQVIGADCI